MSEDKNKFNISKSDQIGVKIASYLVAFNGLYIIFSILINEFNYHRLGHINLSDINITLVIALSLIYLSTLLRRRKRSAWLVTVMAYTFYLGINLDQFFNRNQFHFHNIRHMAYQAVIRLFILPILIVLLLFLLEDQFVVKSNVTGFKKSLKFIVVILLVALLYGFIGFQLMDKPDFHQEIGPLSALHYTIDQFNLTTTPLHPYTQKARFFVDSLSLVSIVSVAYACLSLFQPLKTKFSYQKSGREKMVYLLDKYKPMSEEFFKIWPEDKQYFFSNDGEAGLAYRVHSGVALCVSDPVGSPDSIISLLADFQNTCFSNDWLPAQIHVSDDNIHIYEDLGYSIQKLGEEAFVDIKHFQTNLLGTKYFRQILNRFNKQDYSYEVLSPPHHKAVINRLNEISDDWISKGRDEMGLVMGYFTEEYMQLCDVLVVRDAAGTIQSFINIVPAPFDHEEITYDMIRYISGSLGNINDYMIIRLIEHADKKGYKRLNMGLSPLVGMENVDPEKATIIDNFLHFAYSNGDRFYNFSGLHKFKDKYEPHWSNRYIAYQGGIKGFSRSLAAQTFAMRSVAKHHLKQKSHFKNK